MKLEELQASLLDMSQEKKLALIREIREDRRVSKHAITHKAKQKKDRGAKMEERFKELSKEEQAELLKLLGGQDA